MDFYKTTAAFGATACLLMASTALGTSIESETFEDTLTANTGWLAEGNAAEQVTLGSPIAAPAPAGFPTLASSSAKALEIAGSATRTYSNLSSDPTMVDMMVKVSIPDDALVALSTEEGGEAEGAKFAVAVDVVSGEATKGQFKYWTGSAWAPLSTETFEADAWVRLTMKFDYTNNKCTVALNGNTCAGGPFNLIADASSLASVQVKGSTAIDEVVVAQNAAPAFSGDEAIATGATATKKWLTANDVTWPASTDTDAIAKLDTQYKLGLDPKTNDTTLPLSFEQDSSTTKAKLSFPGLGAYGGNGTYVLQSKTGSGNWGNVTGDDAEITSVTGGKTAVVTLPNDAGTAVYYRILAKPAN